LLEGDVNNSRKRTAVIGEFRVGWKAALGLGPERADLEVCRFS
jgi:hypothetical protein